MEILGVVLRGRRTLSCLIGCGVALFVQLSTSAAKNVTLGWNASPDAGVAGYRIYYGGASGVYTNAATFGNVLSGTVSNLTEGATYYFAATAYGNSNPESALSGEISYTVPVTPVNQVPTLDAISTVTVLEDSGTQVVNLSGITAGAGENQVLTVTASSGVPSLIPTPTISYTSPNTSGTLTFTPAPGASGSSVITVTVNDGQAQNNTFSRSFIVTVSPVNDAPTLNAINSITINEDAAAQTVNLSGISSGSANESQTLVVTATSSDTSVVPNPTVAYTSPNATGSLNFTPVANSGGTATITVTVNDGGVQNNTVVRTFNVTVNPVNDVPTLNALGNLTINQNASSQTVNLSGISSGAANESQTLTVTAVSSAPGIIPNPTVNYVSPNAVGTLTLAPVTDATGTATITVTVNDGGAQNNVVTKTFTVTVNAVNKPPTLDVINAVTINEDAGAQAVNLTGIGTGSASESQPLTITAVSSNPGLIPNPTVSYVSPNATGTLTLTPAANSNGTATITVTVNDGQAQNNTLVRTFAVTVNAINDAPTLNPLSNLTIAENASLQTVNLTGISSGAPNEAQTLSVAASSSDTSVIPNPTINYTSPNATGTLAFTPVANASGSATITVTVNDGGTGSSSILRTFTVTVNAANKPPTLDVLTDVTINEDAGAQTLNLTGIGTGSATESQTLSITATSSNPGLIPNPSVSYVSPNATGTLNFAPVANSNGTATITVTVNDGQSLNNTVARTFMVTVNPVNDAPTLNPLSNLSIAENSPLQTVNLTGIGSGAANESQTLTITATSSDTSVIPNPTVSYSSPSATGTLSFAPVANANGSATVTVTVNDGAAQNNIVTRTFTVSINSVNNAPTLDALSAVTISEDAGTQTVNLSGIGSGAANESQTLTVTATSSNPSLIPTPAVSYVSPNATGSLSFTPATNANGNATITVTVDDGQAQNNITTRTFLVTVNAVNDAPSLNSLGNVVINEDAGAQTVNLTGISSGAANESQTLTVTATSSDTSVVPNPTVNYASPNTTGTLSFTPVANASGTATITVTVNDGGAQNNIVTRTFTVTVNTVNDAPTLNALSNVTINEDAGTQSVNLSGITSGAANESQTLTVTAASSNPSLIPNPIVNYTSPNTSGTLTIAPVSNIVGTATITVTVDDGQAQNNTITRTFLVTVNGVNDAPTLNPLADVNIPENAPAQLVSLTGISSGAPNENQTLIVTASSSNPAIIPNPTVNYVSPNAVGTLSFTPVTDANGTAIITVTVNDGGSQNNTVSQTFAVNVSGVNNPPTLNALNNLTINENSGLQTIALTGVSSGAANESQTLVITAVSSDTSVIPNPTITYTSPSATGSLKFAPVTGASGTANITVTVNDGGTENNVVSRTFSVTVTPVNDPPTLDALSNLTIAENAPIQTVNLTGISAGTGENQALTVIANSSNTGLIPNPTVNYVSPNATGTLSFTPVTDANGSATITVTVNDGQAQNNTVTRTFVVTVNGVNNQPTLNAISDVVIDEDAGLTTVNLTGISSGASNEVQTLTVTATSDNQNLISNPTVAYTSPNSTAILSFAPTANSNGTANITVTVNDGQAQNNTITRTFAVVVNDVNDPPSIDEISDLSISGNQPNGLTPVVVNLHGITAGAGESQSLTVTAVSGNTAFIPNPTVDYTSPNKTGTLTFTPSANATGTVAIVVTVSDGQAQLNRLFNVRFAASPLSLSSIPNQFTPPNVTTAPLPFTITSPSIPVDTLKLTAISANTTLVPISYITFGGAGNNRTVTVKPAKGKTGQADITIWASNGSVSNSTTFRLSVNTPGNTPLQVVINGSGTVTPNLSGQNLTPGKTYSMTAVPSGGAQFLGWSGGVSSSATALSFVMKSNLVIQANFSTDPYFGLSGTYNGLFFENTEVRQHSSGSFNAYVDTRGNYSGKLQLAGARYGFSGKIAADGTATATIARTGTNALNLSLRFGGTGQTNRVTGQIDGGNFVASLLGDRLQFDDLHPAPQAGQYTLVLPGGTGNLPGGDGYSRLVVYANGSIVASGLLGDGTAWSQSSYLSKDGQWPFYMPLYSSYSGSMLGWLTFTNMPNDDVAGRLNWIKPALAGELNNKTGFTNQLTAVGSRFVTPANYRTTPLLSMSNASIAFANTETAGDFINSITLGRAGSVNNLSTNRLSMSMDVNYGTFSGWVVEPNARYYARFYGVVHQKRNMGFGYLQDPTRTGGVTIYSGDQQPSLGSVQ